MKLPVLLREIRACSECEAHLPLGPRPIVQVGSNARILIIGQAPGRRVHESGIAWDDPSGERLRSWLGIDREQFYDPNLVALVPMGFCYPGTGPSGDAPPRPECADLWHDVLLSRLKKIEVTLLIGRYAQQHYLPDSDHKTLTAEVGDWKSSAPSVFPLPHPSPRNNRWLKNNPWFEEELTPALKKAVRSVLKKHAAG